MEIFYAGFLLCGNAESRLQNSEGSASVALHYKPGFEALILKAFPVFNYNVPAL
jgi:hypothetical protein